LKTAIELARSLEKLFGNISPNTRITADIVITIHNCGRPKRRSEIVA